MKFPQFGASPNPSDHELRAGDPYLGDVTLAAVERRGHGRLLMLAGVLGLGPERPSRLPHRLVAKPSRALVVAG
jgi:hypothetical protein